ncbi:PQQ-dependent sugar dehydrogenase [Noviherbaspirillum saxi]|uniref:PQQ-dependent sugar dehydrogenase n=1 Tax=Noviherbaspirillum saxi TaxID=2320863 RepID=UPI001314598B|nr:sugar dehydrogenase [Noviherbaspirillum saxi]
MTPQALQAADLVASVIQPLEVPPALAQSPFDEPKNLLVPPGFGVRVFARVAKARFMAVAPNGDVLVSVPSAGKIVLLRERPNDTPQAFDYATGMRNPHDMVFHRIGDVTYLYVAESNRITRSVYQGGEVGSAAREILIDGLPDNSTPELQGRYGHELKNIALSPDHKLYVSIASTCNACVEDDNSDPVRGAIYEYSADGTSPRLFARGLRNAEGLDFLPGTTTLWVSVNNRDDVRVPIDADLDGDYISDRGKLMPSYVDDNPPELFTSVRAGGNYGWPFCNAIPSSSMSTLDTLPDYEFNRDNSVLNCASVDRSAKGILAHSAPLGFSFLHASAVPAAYRTGAAVAQHGCWNCTSLRAGYKVSFFPFDAVGNAGMEIDLVTGFVINPAARTVWGRPVDVVPDARGNLLISDDYANAIYQLYPR